jgi:hypothetical protein
MTKLVWDLVEDRQFEAGLDRGVFYGTNGLGIPWNGLVAIDDSSEGYSIDPIHFDGVKVMDLITYGNYSGTLKAYTYPDAFLEYEGIQEYGLGVYLDDQPQKPFGLSYRTVVGNAEGSIHYKIHVLYELTASADSVTYQTLNSSVNPIEFSWALSGVPQSVAGRRPTVHFIFDSALMSLSALTAVEDILYGTSSTAAYLPDANALLEAAITISLVDNGDGTWTATGDSASITMLDAETFQITPIVGDFIDASTYSIQTS